MGYNLERKEYMFLITPRHTHRTQVSPNRSQDSTELQKFLTPLSLSKRPVKLSLSTFCKLPAEIGRWPHLELAPDDPLPSATRTLDSLSRRRLKVPEAGMPLNGPKLK